MLLLEEKIENTSTCYFDSSNVLACKYLSESSEMLIIFKGGTQYLYSDVSNYTFQRLKVAQSQGEVFNRLIKNKFKCEKVANSMDLTELILMIDNLKKSVQ
jgi:hypothetical protein